ncbi:MAG: c-type cytochrome [Gammaproteobacteria bacterium]|nr:c-type cytochrome [Gammaproteobacteria bacterium]
MKIRKLILISAAIILPTQVFAWPWSTDMMNQPSIKPQEGPPAAFPKRSVPVTGVPTTVKTREEAEKFKSPIPVSEATIKKGRDLFGIYCSACHGYDGKATTPVSERIGAIDLTSEYVQQSLTEGWIWGTITFGSAIMPAYGTPSGRDDKRGSNDLSPEERWYVVNYVKNQLVKDAAGRSTASAQ